MYDVDDVAKVPQVDDVSFFLDRDERDWGWKRKLCFCFGVVSSEGEKRKWNSPYM